MKHGRAKKPDDAAIAAAWASALGLWGVHMHDPVSATDGKAHGAFAWFGFPPTVHVDHGMLAQQGGADELETVFAHEIGHHVLAPATRIASLKIRHQMARALAASGSRDPARHAPLLANVWSDLLVNTRIVAMQREATGETGRDDIGMVRLWRALRTPETSPLMWVYLRASETLWRLPAGTLCDAAPPRARVTGTASLASHGAVGPGVESVEDLARQLRTIARTHPESDPDRLASVARTFAHDPVGGALAFGLIAAPYLVADDDERGGGAAAGSGGTGCADESGPATAAEMSRVLGDRRMWDPPPASELDEASRAAVAGEAGQGLQLADTQALYSALATDVVTVAWYRAQALPYVRPWTRRSENVRSEDLPGPVDVWEAGDDLADLDWPATLRSSPVVVPGVTTRRRSWLEDDAEPGERSITLDVYVDSSGSMRNPRAGSPAVLAGAILVLSILKGGGRVRVTSFSGAGQVAGGETFVDDADAALRDLLHYFGGGTSFPLDLYRDRYAGLPAATTATERHVVVLSDDGLASMFGVRNEAYAHVAATVRRVLTTGTLLLADRLHGVSAVAGEAGYDVIYLDAMDDAPAACAALAEVLHGGA